MKLLDAATKNPPTIENVTLAKTSAERAAEADVVIAMLCDRWPDLFTTARPLFVSIHEQLIAAGLPSGVSRSALRRALGRWTRRKEYLQALSATGAKRIDAAGHCEPVTDEHRAMARQILAKRRRRKLQPKQRLPLSTPIPERPSAAQPAAQSDRTPPTVAVKKTAQQGTQPVVIVKRRRRVAVPS